MVGHIPALLSAFHAVLGGKRASLLIWAFGFINPLNLGSSQATAFMYVHTEGIQLVYQTSKHNQTSKESF